MGRDRRLKITVENNMFQNITASDGAIAFSAGPTAPEISSTRQARPSTASIFRKLVHRREYADLSQCKSVRRRISATGDNQFSQLLVGTANNNTLTVPASGKTESFATGGLDMVTGRSGDSISIKNGHWVVSNGTTTQTLTGIDDVDINGMTYERLTNSVSRAAFSRFNLQSMAVAGETIRSLPVHTRARRSAKR